MDSRATSQVLRPCGAGPHLSALAAMPRSPRMPRAGGTSSRWPLAAGPMACALPLREDPEAAAGGRAGSLGTVADAAVGAASAYRGAAACVSSSRGRGSKAGVGTLCPRVTLLWGSASQPSSPFVCKRRRGERPRDCGPFTPASQQETPCCRPVLPALRAVLGPNGGCCPGPRASWGEGWSLCGPPPALGSTPGMAGQPAGHSTRLSACWGAGRTCPLWHLPPCHRHLPGSGRQSAWSPSRSLPVCNGCECCVNSLGRGVVAACPHGGPRLWSGCAAALPVAACDAPVGRRRRCGMEAAVSAQRTLWCWQARPRLQGSSWPLQPG